MTRVSTRTDRQRYRFRAPSALGWVFFLLAMLFCCSATASSATAPVATGAAAEAVVRAFTPTPDAAFEPVVLASPADHGRGTSCHGGSTHTAGVVLPAPTAPAAVPSSAALAPADPLRGASAIRGPAHDAVRSVDRLRLQIQRI
ncbi:hypothetical protein ACFXOR_17080 [Streptomyces sp. NPDC059164]|uniref:hypothetical protein n=1 Tax=Streptomyces sp. NPDC059164 TaxID=3346750 RepID=UPI0036B01E1C